MTDQPTYASPPDDQAQLDALDAYRALLETHLRAVEAHWQATDALMAVLYQGKQGPEREAAYQAQGQTARAMLQAGDVAFRRASLPGEFGQSLVNSAHLVSAGRNGQASDVGVHSATPFSEK